MHLNASPQKGGSYPREPPFFNFTLIPKAQVSYTGFEHNPLCGAVKLAHKGA